MTASRMFVQPHTLLTADGCPVRARWVFDPADPLAVVLAMFTGNDVVEWSLARDLLTGGIRSDSWVGEGDLRLHVSSWPEPRGSLVLDLRSPDGEARLWADLATVRDFLAGTAVPLAVEDAATARQVDAAIAWCLGVEAL